MDDKDKYGIVIDSGSSGSRIQIFSWKDPHSIELVDDSSILTSPPSITQKQEWSKKISPGVSSYENKVGEVWSHHYRDLVQFAGELIPQHKHNETPIFVLATAGMRMLQPHKQDQLLDEICSSIRKNSKFYLPNCKQFVQIIDGETEGIYGWLSLNYLMGQFNNYDENNKHSIGFMDMGGASTQIAFVPSQDQIDRHKNDLSTVILRNINGQNQEWNVFVETWLGFGANQARIRYLNQLISLSLINSKVTEINDPCLPKGAQLQYEYEGNSYNIQGIGNYAVCLKTIYPLLLKNIPCNDEPCLFNGIHGPKLDFDNDKFVGISEYWYTANDIFKSGGEYNYHSFNEKVREYCESDWNKILENSQQGQYSNLDPEKFLKSACFKASWVINILHEGFDLPRLGIEVSEDTEEAEKIDQVHVPFKSANSINGDELSWTLGKMLLYASSQIEPERAEIKDIGIYPSELSSQQFVPGGAITVEESATISKATTNTTYSILFLFILAIFAYQFSRKFLYKFRRFYIPRIIIEYGRKVPFINTYFLLGNTYQEFELQNSMNSDLEEGLMLSVSSNPEIPNSSFLRTRLNISLAEGLNYDDELSNVPPINAKTYSNFLNKPFPMRTASSVFNLFSANTSRESLNKIPSNITLNKKE